MDKKEKEIYSNQKVYMNIKSNSWKMLFIILLKVGMLLKILILSKIKSKYNDC